MKNSDQKIAYRVRSTAIIWGFATAMLGICVPLTAVAESGAILPLAVIIGASGGTVSVWRSTRRSDSNINAESQERLSALQARIIDLETICSSQEFERERKFQQLESERVDLSVSNQK